MFLTALIATWFNGLVDIVLDWKSRVGSIARVRAPAHIIVTMFSFSFYGIVFNIVQSINDLVIYELCH